MKHATGSMTDGRLADQIKDVYRRIAHAAMAAGRDPQDVKLIAVTKTVPAGLVASAIELGLRDLGESRVQEASLKVPACAELTPGSRTYWHLIGHLQKNKVKAAVGLFDLIHSVDSAALAEEINRQAERAGKVQRVLVQVKVSPEDTKHGLDERELGSLLGLMTRMRHVSVEGLMCIPPYFERPEEARPYFRGLRMLRDDASARGFMLPGLSMGMSHDFETAIAEGATMVRVGTAIFGERSSQ